MIKFKHVDKTYKSGAHALVDISFEIPRGQIVGVIGRNGAGKSTMFKIICGIIDDYEGVSEVFNKRSSIEYSDRISYLPEVRGIDGRKYVLKHLVEILMYKGISKADAEESILYWLEHFGIEKYKNYRISSLSKGNQQKLQIILSIANDPEILILDEPFSGLDLITADSLWKTMIQLRDSGCTIMFSTHDLNDNLNHCDRFLIIDKGRLYEDGSLDEIQSRYDKILEIKNKSFRDGKTYNIYLRDEREAREIFKSLPIKYSEKFQIRDMTIAEIFRRIAGDENDVRDSGSVAYRHNQRGRRSKVLEKNDVKLPALASKGSAHNTKMGYRKKMADNNFDLDIDNFDLNSEEFELYVDDSRASKRRGNSPARRKAADSLYGDEGYDLGRRQPASKDGLRYDSPDRNGNYSPQGRRGEDRAPQRDYSYNEENRNAGYDPMRDYYGGGRVKDADSYDGAYDDMSGAGDGAYGYDDSEREYGYPSRRSREYDDYEDSAYLNRSNAYAREYEGEGDFGRSGARDRDYQEYGYPEEDYDSPASPPQRGAPAQGGQRQPQRVRYDDPAQGGQAKKRFRDVGAANKNDPNSEEFEEKRKRLSFSGGRNAPNANSIKRNLDDRQDDYFAADRPDNYARRGGSGSDPDFDIADSPVSGNAGKRPIHGDDLNRVARKNTRKPPDNRTYEDMDSYSPGAAQMRRSMDYDQGYDDEFDMSGFQRNQRRPSADRQQMGNRAQNARMQKQNDNYDDFDNRFYIEDAETDSRQGRGSASGFDRNAYDYYDDDIRRPSNENDGRGQRGRAGEAVRRNPSERPVPRGGDYGAADSMRNAQQDRPVRRAPNSRAGNGTADDPGRPQAGKQLRRPPAANPNDEFGDDFRRASLGRQDPRAMNSRDINDSFDDGIGRAAPQGRPVSSRASVSEGEGRAPFQGRTQRNAQDMRPANSRMPNSDVRASQQDRPVRRPPNSNAAMDDFNDGARRPMPDNQMRRGAPPRNSSEGMSDSPRGNSQIERQMRNPPGRGMNEGFPLKNGGAGQRRPPSTNRPSRMASNSIPAVGMDDLYDNVNDGIHSRTNPRMFNNVEVNSRFSSEKNGSGNEIFGERPDRIPQDSARRASEISQDRGGRSGGWTPPARPGNNGGAQNNPVQRPRKAPSADSEDDLFADKIDKLQESAQRAMANKNPLANENINNGDDRLRQARQQTGRFAQNDRSAPFGQNNGQGAGRAPNMRRSVNGEDQMPSQSRQGQGPAAMGGDSLGGRENRMAQDQKRSFLDRIGEEKEEFMNDQSGFIKEKGRMARDYVKRNFKSNNNPGNE